MAFCVLYAKSLRFCLIFRNPMDCSPPGSSVHGILQTRILEWVAIPFPGGSSQPRDQTHVSCASALAAATAKSLQLHLTLCNPMDCSPPGSFVHGLLQARILEWFALSCSRGSSKPRNRTTFPVSLALAGRFFTC